MGMKKEGRKASKDKIIVHRKYDTHFFRTFVSSQKGAGVVSPTGIY
jgi:hypothetical protein